MRNTFSIFLCGLLSLLAVSLEAATITNWGSQLPTAAPVGTDVILMQKGGVTYYFTPNQLAVNISTNANFVITNVAGPISSLQYNSNGVQRGNSGMVFTNGTLRISNEDTGIEVKATNDANGAVIDLYFDQAVPLAGARVGEFHFFANTTNGAVNVKQQMAAIYAEELNPNFQMPSGSFLMNCLSSNEHLRTFVFYGNTRLLEINAGNLYGDPTNMSLRVSATGTTNALFVKGDNGFVGVNTGTPGYRFTVVGTNSFNQLDPVAKFYSTIPGTAPTKALYLGYNLTGNIGVIGAVSDGASHDNITIAPHGGKVGVGISPVATSMGSLLTVYGNLSVGTGFWQPAGPTDGAIIQGRVGIGTTNPATSLDVTGQVRSASAIITNSVSLLAKAFAAPASTAFTTSFGAHLWSDGTNLCVVLEDSAGTRTTNKLSMTAWP